jgi:hypothetical protein
MKHAFHLIKGKLFISESEKVQLRRVYKAKTREKEEQEGHEETHP